MFRSVGQDKFELCTARRFYGVVKTSCMIFFFLNREIGYNHPPDVWIYGLVIPLWSNLAGTSAA